MGNAIRSLIAQGSGGGQGDGEECVLLSEEHSLVLTCCWVSLKVKQNQMLHNYLNIKEDAEDILAQFVFVHVFLSGNRNLFRFFGGKDSLRIQTQQVPSNKRGSNESIESIQEYSSQMPPLGKFCEEAQSLNQLSCSFLKKQQPYSSPPGGSRGVLYRLHQVLCLSVEQQ